MQRHLKIWIFTITVLVPSFAIADPLNVSIGSANGSLTSNIIQIIAITTVLSIAPSILVMVTSFTRIIVVLSLLRSALGTQTTPPSAVLISLALFLTAFIMQPTFDESYNNAIKPLMAGQISEGEAYTKGIAPFKAFMLQHTRKKDLELFINISKVKPATAADTPITTIVPAFMISELKRAFEIGFLLFIPFLIIDMLISSILMAMGMMMLPPVVVSLPFKLIFFVLIDGWYMVAGSLLQSYGTG